MRSGIDGRTAALTLVVLVAFASNSLLTRGALGAHEIDAAAFTAVRLIAGAAALALIARVQSGTWAPLRGAEVVGPAALFAYAVPFSFAYLRIGAAVGALVLFGAVQLTMIGYGLARGERPAVPAWIGVVLAVGGLGMLTLSPATRPDPTGLLLMAMAGAAWGVYSLAGRGQLDPIASNARSFFWSGLAALPLALAPASRSTATARGFGLALISGALTSGVGYALWYRVLPRLSVTQASVAQLSVPIIAALGAVVLLGEAITPRLVISGVAVLAGVGLVLSARTRRTA
ncbi:MAG: DMT family transporter [Acidobacteria bacterium]|nr:DMT family transporter [Acidobacteriota bacterium]